jgi:hypothetical protein
MRGKKARAIRRIAGFKTGSGIPKRQYKTIESARTPYFTVNKDATAKAGETRLDLKHRSSYTVFHNDAARAVYRNLKKKADGRLL